MSLSLAVLVGLVLLLPACGAAGSSVSAEASSAGQPEAATEAVWLNARRVGDAGISLTLSGGDVAGAEIAWELFDADAKKLAAGRVKLDADGRALLSNVPAEAVMAMVEHRSWAAGANVRR